MKDTDIAYIAGLIDGEGCLRIKKTKAYRHLTGRVNPCYQAVIQIRMVDEPAIKFISQNLGGWYYKEKPHAVKGRPLFCFQASDKHAITIIRTIRPFLKVKAIVADILLAFETLKLEGRRHRTKITGYRNFPNKYGKPRVVANKGYSDEYIAHCESLYLATKQANRVGI